MHQNRLYPAQRIGKMRPAIGLMTTAHQANHIANIQRAFFQHHKIWLPLTMALARVHGLLGSHIKINNIGNGLKHRGDNRRPTRRANDKF